LRAIVAEIGEEKNIVVTGDRNNGTKW